MYDCFCEMKRWSVERMKTILPALIAFNTVMCFRILAIWTRKPESARVVSAIVFAIPSGSIVLVVDEMPSRIFGFERSAVFCSTRTDPPPVVGRAALATGVSATLDRLVAALGMLPATVNTALSLGLASALENKIYDEKMNW